jgi:SAM-dependent methyltransferase
VLDYGCGRGDVVKEARAQGIDAWGVDSFYEGGDLSGSAAQTGLLGTAILGFDGRRLPFPDETFDLVLSNQVFEHVDDLPGVMDEIRRVLKPGGRLLALFPSRGVLREGHVGIPFVHRFRPGSRLRYPYTLSLRRLGLGYWKGDKTPAKWSRDVLEWLDAYTYYRPRREIRAAFRGFRLSFAEAEYAAYRLQHSPRLRRIRWAMRLPLIDACAPYLVRSLAGMVILAERAAPSGR